MGGLKRTLRIISRSRCPWTWGCGCCRRWGSSGCAPAPRLGDRSLLPCLLLLHLLLLLQLLPLLLQLLLLLLLLLLLQLLLLLPQLLLLLLLLLLALRPAAMPSRSSRCRRCWLLVRCFVCIILLSLSCLFLYSNFFVLFIQ